MIEAIIWCPECKVDVCQIVSEPTGNEGVSQHKVTDLDNNDLEKTPKVCPDCATVLERKPND